MFVLLDLLDGEDARRGVSRLLLLEVWIYLVALVCDERAARAEVAALRQEDKGRRHTLYRQEPDLARGVEARQGPEERPRVGHQGIVEDLVGRALLHGAPGVHHRHLVGDL